MEGKPNGRRRGPKRNAKAVSETVPTQTTEKESPADPLQQQEAAKTSYDAKASKSEPNPAPPRMSDRAKNAARKGPTPTRDEGLFKEAIFSPDGITDYPVDRLARYNPMVTCFETLTNQVYIMLTSANKTFIYSSSFYYAVVVLTCVAHDSLCVRINIDHLQA